jgi:universal stress protein E
MKRFKNILLVVNGRESDKQSLARAAELAQRNNASLSLIEVIEAPEGEIHRLGSKLNGLNLSELIINDRTAWIEKLLKDANIAASQVDVLIGIPFIEIIRKVQQNAKDLVVMAAEGKGGLNERLFGTTSLHLMRKCPCPVWVLHTTHAARHGKILAAVDPTEQDPVKGGLNRKIMELAASLAEIEKGELHIVHVWEFLGESLLVNRGAMTHEEVKAVVAETKEKHRQALEEIVNQHPSKKIRKTLHLLRGHPGEMIPKCAEENKADLIVMGTVSRQGIAGFLIGNTAEQVLQKVNASVLTLKPEGFLSPVQ